MHKSYLSCINADLKRLWVEKANKLYEYAYYSLICVKYDVLMHMYIFIIVYKMSEMIHRKRICDYLWRDKNASLETEVENYFSPHTSTDC